MSEFVVRSAVLSDLDQLLDAAGEFFQEGEFRTLTYDRERYRDVLIHYISQVTTEIIGAWDGQILCGYVIICALREYTVETIGEQYQLYIRPEYRGTKVSRLLATATESRFDDWNCVVSHTAADPRFDNHPKNNQLFCNLWKKFGYKQTGILMTKVRHG